MIRGEIRGHIDIDGRTYAVRGWQKDFLPGCRVTGSGPQEVTTITLEPAGGGTQFMAQVHLDLTPDLARRISDALAKFDGWTETAPPPAVNPDSGEDR